MYKIIQKFANKVCNECKAFFQHVFSDTKSILSINFYCFTFFELLIKKIDNSLQYSKMRIFVAEPKSFFKYIFQKNVFFFGSGYKSSNNHFEEKKLDIYL